VTEAEWRNCRSPISLLRAARERVSPRKGRLFTVGCCYHIWGFMKDRRSRAAVQVAERFAEGEASREELCLAHEAACDAVDEAERSNARNIAQAATAASDPGGAQAFLACDCTRISVGTVVREAELALAIELFGNPFRAVYVDPSLLSWNDGLVVKIAQGIYEERAFDRMPILHDALLDAGCDDEALLSHCRNAKGHVRGCWAIDLLTGRA
jgi:hypothetical protein